MADLRKLFAKDSNATPASTESNDSNKSGQLSSAAPVAAGSTPKPANPFAQASNVGSGDSGERVATSDGTSGNVDSGSGESSTGVDVGGSDTGTQHQHSDTGGVDSPSLDSLDALDSSEDAGTAPRGSGLSYFSDETPATKPTRELPEGLTKEQLGFVDTLDSIYNILHDPELLGGVIKNIMIELKNNAEYTRLMTPDDVRAMVRGMRDSMGLAKVKKQEAKSKRSGGSRKSSKVDLDMLADLDSLGIE